ncbi:MAG TPA: M1 family aminopeptidase [Longimicrobium sp.]|nr:M1 family aminopeptidase [Longimicrobium sp.]
MIGGMIGFEWRHQARQVAFHAAALGFLVMGIALVSAGYGPENLHVNSPYVIVQATGLLSLPAIFVLTIFCTGAMVRDTEHRMAEIVFATPVGKTRYLAARFTGALLVSAAVFGMAMVGMALAPLLVVVEPERLGSIDPVAYLWAFVLIGLPNLVVIGALVFAVAALTRSTLASYVGGVFLYALYFLCAIMVDSPLVAGTAPAGVGAMTRAALIDPFGLSAFAEQTRLWAPETRNVRYLSPSGRLLANRVLWLAISAAVLAAVHHTFRMRVNTGRTRAAAPSVDASTAVDAPASAEAYAPVAVGGRGAGWRALVSATRVQLAYVLRSRPFLALMALWVVVAWANMSGSDAVEYGTRLYPTTGILLSIARPMLAELGTVVLVYFSAELMWRDRAAHLSEILDATPTASAVFYLARLAALALTVTVMTVSTLAVSIVFQLSRGYPHVQAGPLLSFFATALVPLLLFAVLALLAQSLAPNRYVGMVAALGLAILALRGESFGLEHHMVRYASGPQAPHSDLAGGGQAAASFWWFMLYWTAFAALLALATVAAWRRGTASSLRRRLAAIPRRLGRRGRSAATACLALFLCTGAFVFHNTNAVNDFETRDESLAWSAAYERAYSRHAATPQPSVVAVRADVALDPARRGFSVDGSFDLLNRGARPVDTVWVSAPLGVDFARVEMEGADRFVADERFGMHGFRMRTPLAPGARALLRFHLRGEQRGVRTSGFDRSVVDNGSLLTNGRAFPRLGYRGSYEIDDAAERRRHGLPARPDAPDAGLADAPEEPAGDWATFETTVSTVADQIAVAPGELRREWRQGGRRYFHYVLDRPSLNQFGYTSARYRVRRVTHRGVAVEVCFHPTHERNVERMLRAATASLDAFSAAFGPYPHRTLRIVEVPSYSPFGAFATPGLIYFNETRGFLTDARDSTALDLVTRRVAHEVAHQWWGHQVNPGAAPGASTIVESLAKYGEQMVLRRLRGDGEVTRVAEFDLQRYVMGRAQEKDAEPPLSRAAGQPYLYYGKGAVVMNGLRDLLGDAAMNRALRRLVAEHGPSRPPARAADLVRVLAAEARPADRPLVERWMTDVAVYDLAVDSATSRRLPDGRYLLRAWIRAGATARRGTADVPLPLDERVDLAVFADHPARAAAEPLEAAKHRVRSGVTVVDVVVRGRPAFIAIDPYVRRVDVDRRDNLRPVTAAASPLRSP